MENKKNAASRSQVGKRGGEKAPQRNKSNHTYRDEKRVYQPKSSYGAFDRKDRFVKEKAEPIKVVENEINDTESIHGDCETGAVIGRNAVRELLRSDRSIDKLMVQRGELTREAAKSHPGKNLITRAVGTESSVECDIFHHRLIKGDSVLLCSDGLSNLLSDQEILFEVVHGVHRNDCCQRLMKIANYRGSPDNVTIALISM